MSELACRVFREHGAITARMVELSIDEMMPGEVVIRAEWSGLNFKDALGITGRAPIYRHFPITAGIDVAGTVIASSDPRFEPGAAVLVNGQGLGESHDGGFATIVRVPADWVVPLPQGLDAREAMALGTAGFSAALALHRMEVNGQAPDMGPVVVTGATGGVGSAAVSMLAARGYRVIAISGRPEHVDHLLGLGAAEVRTPDEFGPLPRPLASAALGGVIDCVGGTLLGRLIPRVAEWGNVASVGNAAGTAIETSVFPFILRGVSLLGISSANCPTDLRARLWTRLGTDLKPPHLAAIVSRTVALPDVITASTSLLDRAALGRVLVDCRQPHAGAWSAGIDEPH